VEKISFYSEGHKISGFIRILKTGNGKLQALFALKVTVVFMT
jgi:hypothetical protein